MLRQGNTPSEMFWTTVQPVTKIINKNSLFRISNLHRPLYSKKTVQSDHALERFGLWVRKPQTGLLIRDFNISLKEHQLMRGRPFQPGNTFGQGRPRGSRNKRLMAQRILLESGP